MLLNVEHLYKYFNGQALLKDINFTVEDREAVGLIGINGCGKSTLLNIITGSEGYDKTPEGLGSVNIAGKASIGFLRQNSGLNSELTIGEEMKKHTSESVTSEPQRFTFRPFSLMAFPIIADFLSSSS